MGGRVRWSIIIANSTMTRVTIKNDDIYRADVRMWVLFSIVESKTCGTTVHFFSVLDSVTENKKKERS